MPVEDLGSYTLGEINVGLSAGLVLMNPLLLQVDLLVTGQFGLSAYMLDSQSQFNAAISAVLQLNIGISDPLSAIKDLLASFAMISASLAFALSFGLPTVSLQISEQVSAMAALGAGLSLKLGGLKALLAASLSAKIPALSFVQQFTAALAAGPAHLVLFRGDTLAGSGAELAATFAGGLGPSDPLYPTDLVDGILIVTKDPAVFSAIAAILKTSI